MVTGINVSNEELQEAVIQYVSSRIATRAEYEFWDKQAQFIVNGGEVGAVVTFQLKESEYKNGRK